MHCVTMALMVLGLPLAGCLPQFDGTACTDLFAYGVNATVTNATTGAPITDATLTLTEGTYTEVMQLIPTGDYVGAGERAGTYTLTATAPQAPPAATPDTPPSYRPGDRRELNRVIENQQPQ